jgi:hypothetical protein
MEVKMQMLTVGFNAVPMLAQVSMSGSGAVYSMLYLLLIGVCLGIVWWLGRYIATKLGGPPAFFTFWNIAFVIVVCLLAINFLLGLVGHPFVTFTR